MTTPSTRRIDRFLQMMRDRGASDLHMSVGRPPMLRVSGELEPVRFRVLDDDQFRAMIEPIAPPVRWEEYVRTGDTDFAYELPGVARFRVNLFRQQRGMGAVFRVIPTRIMGLEELGLPPQVSHLTELDGGLVLVTGPTGSGKSTTLAALIDRISATHDYHIITIEDPIEFVYPVRRSLIHQREIGMHATSFSEALRAAVREDPDLILVGELRDLETIAMALSAAERGIIVYATLHTNSAAKTVDRMINVFPASEQEGIRNILGESLRAVIAQQLLPTVKGGRVAALEILFCSPAIGTMIREAKTAQITSAIRTGSRAGMIDMDSSIRTLWEEGVVSPAVAYDHAIDKEAFAESLREAGAAVPGA